ncbi:hypothetical protein [Allosalinactinospora lopnorensis]|uniref:hypothetical protein n=1 Tax=Allosalinactinospora lopnorensis TaxID=1352348 RepID=UPI000623C83C|nr:hypothetical protein [Allosalinactinospora lopnorensis]
MVEQSGAGLRGLAAIVVGTALLAGCSGGGSGDSAAGPAVTLLDRLADIDETGAVAVDLERARQKLGVDAADTESALLSEDPAERHFGGLASAALGPLIGPFDTPVTTAIDTSRVTAVASKGMGATTQRTTVLATDQPFSEVAEELEAEGYSRDGDVLEAPKTEQPMGIEAVSGDAEVIVVGDDAEAVRDAAEDRGDGSSGAVRELIESVDAPAAAAYAPGGGCPEAIAVADDIDDRRARVVVVTDSPQADRFTALQGEGAYFKGLSFDEPQVDGDRITAGLSYSEDNTAAHPLMMLTGDLPPDELYDCG